MVLIKFNWNIGNHLIVIVTFWSCILSRKCADADELGIIYTCCAVENSFNGETCESCSRVPSEFETHQALWTVPEQFRPNQSSSFQLKLEPRNIKNNNNNQQYCLRINHNVSESGTSISSTDLGNEELDKDIFPKFHSNGTMFYKGKIYNPFVYCVDRISEEHGSTILNIAVKDNDHCKQAYGIRQPYNEKWINQLFAAVSGLSCLFTIINVIIYLSLRNYLNVSGWIEFAYFLSLGVFSAFVIPAFLCETASHKICYFISVVLQFSEIMASSSYFMVAFDVYWMLRKSDAFASYGEEIEESKMRVVIYYLLLLAVPIGVSTYGIILNFESKEPMYGVKSCFAPAWPVADYLLFGIESATLIIILLSINHILGRLSASTDVDDAPRVSLLSNLFFFTLSYWVMDLLKFARPLLLNGVSQKRSETSSTNMFWIWTVLDGFTYAQGVLSFVVFVFNRKTLKAFRKKAGTDSTMRAIFRHACCGNGDRIEAPPEDGGTPLSPLMKRTNITRSVIRRSHLY